MRMRLDMGMPTVFYADGDGMLANSQVASFLDSHGTKTELSGPHAPWQNGTAERHGGLIKLLVRRFF